MEKVILFDGKDLNGWTQENGDAPLWDVRDGIMTVTRKHIVSKEVYQDAWIHLEFRTPFMPDASGQKRGNSGVFIQGRYEIQVLDSYGFEIPGKGDCGAFYNTHAPLVNACKPPMEWQMYDIVFRSPRTDAQGQITEYARATVFQNGIPVLNNVELKCSTKPMEVDLTSPGPLMLQDHLNPVSYRNIWMIHLPLKGSDQYEPG